MANEKRLIDANELTDRLNHTTMVAYPNLFPGLLAAVEIVDDSPTVDAVEVVHGRWEKRTEKNIWGDMQTVYGCTNCKKFSVKGKGITVESDFCPNCGAKMDGGEENATT